jgi:DNA/RNA-binding domain of Phe-tRNA-synthetase-like protein
VITPAISPDLPARVRLGLVAAAPILARPLGPELEAEIEATCRGLVAEHAGLQPASIAGLGPARDLYRSFGIDPTRTRPSSEALLRRALQGKPFPRILNAVDLCNLCAVRFLLPIGLYDADLIRGAVVLRRGGPGEAYQGIRKDEVHLEGRPALCDEEGPFGNPTSDSLRTSVTPETRALLMVIFAPAGYPRPRMESHVTESQRLMEQHLGGAAGAAAVVTEGLVPPGD